jgi:hypothetical protein
MASKHLLGLAAAATIVLAPGAARAQGNNADAATAANSAAGAPTSAPANLLMGNSAAGGPAAPAAVDSDAADRTVPHPVYRVERGFPWGILGLIGLIGLLPLFRRRDG